jgi:hypothetical protein
MPNPLLVAVLCQRPRQGRASHQVGKPRRQGDELPIAMESTVGVLSYNTATQHWLCSIVVPALDRDTEDNDAFFSSTSSVVTMLETAHAPASPTTSAVPSSLPHGTEWHDWLIATGQEETTQLRIFSGLDATEAFLQPSRLHDWAIYAAILHTSAPRFWALVPGWRIEHAGHHQRRCTHTHLAH